MDTEIPRENIQYKIANRLKEIVREIAEEYEFEIDTVEVINDHVHLFLSVPVPLRYAPAVVVQRMKSISAKVIFQEFPEIRRVFGAENSGATDTLFVPWAIGDKGTADVIRRYIKYQHNEQIGFEF